MIIKLKNGDVEIELFDKNRNLKLIISGVDKKVSNKSIIPNNFKDKSNITIDKVTESTYQNAKIINKLATNEIFAINPKDP